MSNYNHNFSDRMERAKTIAMNRRNAGLPAGRPAKGAVRKRSDFRPENDFEWRELIELKMEYELMSAVNEVNWEYGGNDGGCSDEIPF